MFLMLLGACILSESDTCRTTCSRLYTAGDDGCDIQRPGRTTNELVESCRDACFEAMQTGGEVGDYDPYERVGSSVAVELENKAQAQLWAECVAETSCDNLADGFCAPVW
jgi:hypothetical protein